MAALLVLATGATPCPRASIAQVHMSADALQSHVRMLASEDFEGRGAGYPGEKLAAEYIAAAFRDSGLEPFAVREAGHRAYLQTFEMHALQAPDPWLTQTSQNVVGVLPGLELTEEIIVVGAHYDGQGMSGQAKLGRRKPSIATADTIWNSAVDNAVSVAVLIEAAKRLAASHRLRRTVVFVAFGAEESALAGSIHYANHPVGGHAATKAIVNLEKIVGDADAPLLYVSFGTSAAFPAVTETVARRNGIDLTPFYPGIVDDTDHYPFIIRGVPGITIGTGSVENVHLPSDHADGLDFTLLAERARLITAYVSELAGTELDIVFEGDLSGHYGALGGTATHAETGARGFDGGVAFKVASIVSGTPAQQSGLRPGDLVISINGEELAAQDLDHRLEDLLPEDRLCEASALGVIRGIERERVQLNLEPGCR